jgi:hypothetical protein
MKENIRRNFSRWGYVCNPTGRKGAIYTYQVINHDLGLECVYWEKRSGHPAYTLLTKEGKTIVPKKEAQYRFNSACDEYFQSLINQLKKKYAISHSGDVYEQVVIGKENALVAGELLAKDVDQDFFYIAEVIETPIVVGGITVDNIINEVAEGHMDEYGEFADDAYFIFGNRRGREKEIDDLEKRIISVFEDWARYWDKLPNWYHIKNAEIVKLEPINTDQKDCD